MKLATYRDGSRDGQLVVVSRDLSQASHAAAAATRLQQVLDDWNFLSPQLVDLSVALNQGKARHAFAFEPQRCMAPLPRAYQRLGAVVAPQPSLQALVGDVALGPHDDARFAAADEAIGFGAQVAVVTGDIAAGATPERALEGVRLVLLVNAWTSPALGGSAVDGGLPAAFSPVAVTPEELGAAWSGGRVHLPLRSTRNGRELDAVDAGAAMSWHFGELIALAARHRRLSAGTIVGSGPVSGSGMGNGDTIRIEMRDATGGSIFGAIEQRVTGPQPG